MSANPLLAPVRVPGESFQLPSLGLFYHDGELDESVKDATIHIYPMRSIDKVNLSSGNLLATGDIINVVFQHCAPEIKKPELLTSKDVQFILTCMQVVTYGHTMDIIVKGSCPDAFDEEHTVNLYDMIRKAEKLDPTTVDDKFKCVVSTGQVVRFKPILIKDSMYIDSMTFKIMQDEDLSLDQVNEIMLDLLGLTIQSVDGIADRTLINEWLHALSDNDIQTLRPHIENVGDYGLNELVYLESKECEGELIPVDVVTNNLRFFI